MDHVAQQLIAFTSTHPEWATAIMFITAFGESFVFVSLLFPGTTMLIAAGTLIETGGLPFLPILVGAVLGAVLGDAVSYWIGRRFGGRIAGIWPFTRNPALLSNGVRFFERHGGKSVFIGRFFGPIRAVVPLAAGIMRMPPRRFWIANTASALVWGPMLLLAGDVVGIAGKQLIGSENAILLIFGALVVFGIVAALWTAARAARPKE